MLRSSSEFKDLPLAATDGDIGFVEGFCFDEREWSVRYIVVNTGGWIHPRKVLISSPSMGTVDWTEKTISTNLTRAEVKACPQIADIAASTRPMRGTEDFDGLQLATIDGDIGHIEELIIDDETWAIRYLVVDTRNWLLGKKVTLSPRWIDGVDWKERKIKVELSRAEIENSPEYDDSSIIDRDYEERLHDHYGQPGYWNAEAISFNALFGWNPLVCEGKILS